MLISCVKLDHALYLINYGINTLVNTYWRKSQLSASYTGISKSPLIITHSAPCAIDADFYTSFKFISSINQPDLSISAV